MREGVQSEGATAGCGSECAYSAAIREMRRGGSGLHRGQLVAIAGEPGMHAYRVMAVDPARGMATVCREESTRESWRLPAAALQPLE